MQKKLYPLMAAGMASVALAGCGGGTSSSDTASSNTPNILFIVLDDFGVDQLRSFGYGGLTPAQTPNLDTIAQQGVRFHNAWSMPTCSPSRATFFEGRYPFRTNVNNAIVALDLANSQVSPYEFTTPKLLKEKGYINAVIGKMHLSGSDLGPANNPLGDRVMHELGWDYFEGFLDGGPYPIDTTAGGVAGTNGSGPYGCGFVPSTSADPVNGADTGACYQPTGACSELTTDTVATPGRTCMEQGGIFDPSQVCRITLPSYIDFTRQNAYYTGEWIINHPDGSVEKLGPEHPHARGYRSILETDRAIAWIKNQKPDQPWMLSLGYSAIHTPVQQPPVSLLPSGAIATDGFTCTTVEEQRVITNQMTEALDREIGRLLVEIGLARYKEDGTIDYHPERTNTAVIIMGDNGTYAPSVKEPFDPTRAKGFPYQTGVWVPLIVAGPMVKEPGRTLPHMVNSVDMFRLFAELAEVDVTTAVPDYRPIDAQPVLPYLLHTDQTPIRSINYTEVGDNIKSVNEAPPPPCVIPASNVCVQIFPQQGVCEDQGGIWYGPGGAAGAAGLSNCCMVNDFLADQGEAPVTLFPRSQRALRNDDYKLVELERLNCETQQFEVIDELYRIDQAVPLPRIDRAIYNLLTQRDLPPETAQQYATLRSEMQQLRDPHIDCPGDGNGDLLVNADDITQWQRFHQTNNGQSSWYDFNHDGYTNEEDLKVIHDNMGMDCRRSS